MLFTIYHCKFLIYGLSYAFLYSSHLGYAMSNAVQSALSPISVNVLDVEGVFIAPLGGFSGTLKELKAEVDFLIEQYGVGSHSF